MSAEFTGSEECSASRARHSSALGAQHSALSTAFSFPVRVYYQDTDAGGVVFHSTYLNFMERARVEWLRQLGFDNHDLTLTHRVIFMVRSITIDYLKPAHLDDVLHVTVETAEVGRSRVILGQHVLRGHAVLASARVGVVCVSLETFKPVSVPAAIRHKFESKP